MRILLNANMSLLSRSIHHRRERTWGGAMVERMMPEPATVSRTFDVRTMSFVARIGHRESCGLLIGAAVGPSVPTPIGECDRPVAADPLIDASPPCVQPLDTRIGIGWDVRGLVQPPMHHNRLVHRQVVPDIADRPQVVDAGVAD